MFVFGNLIGKGHELGGFAHRQLHAVNVLDPIGIIGVDTLLHIINKVLYQIVECRGIGILPINAPYARQITVFAHGPANTGLVALLGKDVEGSLLLARMIEGTGIDVAHQILVDTCGQILLLLLPIGDVGLMVLQQHVRTHGQQRVLSVQTSALITRSSFLHVLQHLSAGSQLLLGGITPRLAKLIRNVEIVVQMFQIGHHLAVTLLPGGLHDFLPIPAVTDMLIVHVGFPILIETLFQIEEVHIAGCYVHHVVVVGRILSRTGPALS